MRLQYPSYVVYNMFEGRSIVTARLGFNSIYCHEMSR